MRLIFDIFDIISSFFSMIADFAFAAEVKEIGNLSFKTALLRRKHQRNGHPFSEKVRVVDKLRSEAHPHTDAEMIYTVNLVECQCGLIYQDCGIEFRDRSWITNKTENNG